MLIGFFDEAHVLYGEPDFYLESLRFNSCLNRKLSVDARGEIRNCPSMPASFGNAKTTMDINLELFDFGTSVQAPAPPAADVTDLSKLGTGTS